jgi:hypothetical protein
MCFHCLSCMKLCSYVEKVLGGHGTCYVPCGYGIMGYGLTSRRQGTAVWLILYWNNFSQILKLPSFKGVVTACVRTLTAVFINSADRCWMVDSESRPETAPVLWTPTRQKLPGASRQKTLSQGLHLHLGEAGGWVGRDLGGRQCLSVRWGAKPSGPLGSF